jgi:LAS superfamily LD-carboxypeptidase LdcB
LKNTSIKEKSYKPPKFVYFLFGGFMLLAGFNILNSIGDLKSFGVFEEVYAAFRNITGKPAPNFGQIASTLVSGEPIEESTDRCLIIDPNLPEPVKAGDVPRKASAVLLGDNISGFNQGLRIESDMSQIHEITNQLGGSYTIGIAFNPSDSASTAKFIENATESNLIPIIRLCVVGSCGFTSPESIVSFYNSVNGQASSEFIAMIGPNEPTTGTPTEMEGFGYANGDYDSLVADTNSIAEQLQAFRVVNGGNMYLSPGAFNMVTEPNADTDNYKRLLNPALYDYLMGNAYEILARTSLDAEGNESGESYGYYATRLKEYVDQNNLKFILTEFGIFRGQADESTLKEYASLSFASFCADENVVGALFFRALEGIPIVQADHTISTDEIAEIIGDCQRARKKKAPDLAWQTCNFDSCLYDYAEDPISTANSCGVTDQVPEEGEGLLFVHCGGPNCTTKKQFTVEVSLPIKQFGSNSYAGTLTHPYPSICAELASLVTADGYYDPLNQFAGRLTSAGAGDYPMPWLGSAINCSSELIKTAIDFASSENFRTMNPNPGSVISQTLEEIEQEVLRALSVRGTGRYDPSVEGSPNLEYEDNDDIIIDERAICNGENCFDKEGIVGNPTVAKPYIPLLLSQNYSKPEQCSATNLTLRSDPSNYIIGPEMLYGDEFTDIINPDDICINYAKRSLPSDDDLDGFIYETDISCNMSPDTITTQEGLVVTCPLIRCANGAAIEDPEFGALSGQCYIPDGLKECVMYNSTSNDEIYRKSKGFPSIPNYDIPGIYDSLHVMYQRLQNRLSAQGLKLVVRENIGWEMKVAVKMRDTNRTYGEVPYFYDQTLPETPGASACTIPGKIFDNNALLAKGTSIVNKSEYFDWLGYVDIFQEYQVALTTNNIFEITEIVENDFTDNSEYDQNLLPAGLKKGYLVKTREGALSTSFPILSCDDVERLKYDINIPEDQRLPADLELTCITTLNDNSYQDRLVDFLCEQGYEVEGACSRDDICSVLDGVLDPNFNLSYPLENVTLANMSSDFGVVRNYTNSSGQVKTDVHRGLDFPVPSGTPVLAAADGEVIDAGFNDGGLGYYVKILHSNGFVTLYGHNSELLVDAGMRVTRGQVIANSGSTGNSTGPHLHFELRRDQNCRGNIEAPGEDGCTLDPKTYLTGVVDTTNPTIDPEATPEEEETNEEYSQDDLVLYPASPVAEIPNCAEPSALQFISTDLFKPNGDQQLIPEAKSAFESMLNDMRQNDPAAYNSCGLRWAYRSADIQRSFGTCGRDTACACHSEHQLGTTVDFIENGQASVGSFAGTACYNWLNSNAHNYGFIQSYTSGNPDYIAEPWHWRWIPQDIANEFKSQSSYQYLREFLDSRTNFPEADAANLEDITCVVPGDIPDQPGVLSCQISTSETGANIDFSQNIRQIEARIEAYNLDSNASYTWLANIEVPENAQLKESLIAHLGSQQAYENDRAQRIEVTNYVISRSKELGINPRFAFALWVEETAGSALGVDALGCNYFRDGTQTGDMSFDGNKDNMKNHLDEQLRCLKTYIDEFPEFTQFMCTYSGEIGRPDCDINNFTNNPNFPNKLCRYYAYLPL